MLRDMANPARAKLDVLKKRPEANVRRIWYPADRGRLLPVPRGFQRPRGDRAFRRSDGGIVVRSGCPWTPCPQAIQLLKWAWRCGGIGGFGTFAGHHSPAECTALARLARIARCLTQGTGEEETVAGVAATLGRLRIARCHTAQGR